ncbi:hypothetical protein RRF57_010749 [Xylaria bambusicola]|uniref:Period circadian protein n=1 Tax=Xylaria bambusicola TaxID=326684 RepID=A0AAN7USX0_9PEZI
MLASILVFSLSVFTGAVSASAIPQHQQHGLEKRQNTNPIPTFSFGPSSTVYLGGGASTGVANTSQAATATAASAIVSTSAVATATSTAVETRNATTTTETNTGSATGTIPTYSFLPSSTVLVGPGATDKPAGGNGNGNGDGNGRGGRFRNGNGNQRGNNTAGDNGTGNGAGDNKGNDDKANLDNLTSLLKGLLDLLQN